MRPISRILIAFAALAMGILLWQPIWRIDLWAPQYPEGLVLQIYHNTFTGNVDQINGLNHYIGMATINNAMFPEFAIMRYAIGLLIGCGRLSLFLRIGSRHPDSGQHTHSRPNHSCLLHHGDCSLVHAG